MLCSITDRPAPDTEDLPIPSGIDVIRQLPHKVAQEILDDTIFDAAGNGWSHSANISAAFGRRDWIAVMNAVEKWHDAAGSSGYAIEQYREHCS